jgi:hypothetical protein
VVPWKYAIKGNLDSYKSRKRRKECEEEHWRQMMEQRLKEQEEKMQVEIERRLAIMISQIAQTGALPEVPLDPVISPSARKSSCACTEVAPSACIEVAPGAYTEGLEEPRAIEGVPVDDNQQYPVDFLCRCTPCERHKPFGNLTMQVAYGSTFAHFPRQTSHGMLIPPGYASVSVEEICQPQFEDLELDIPGGDGERTLKDAVHGIILWPKRYIIIPIQRDQSLLQIPRNRDHRHLQGRPHDLQCHLAHRLHKNHYSIPEVRAPAMILTSIPNHLKKAEKTMAAKQAPSKQKKTPKHRRKNRPTTKAHQKNNPATKAHQKKPRNNRRKKPSSHESTTEKTVGAQSSNPMQPPKLKKPPR